MNPSSYGLMILIQCVVEPIHFMDLGLNLTFFGMSLSTLGSTSDLALGDESVYYVD